MLWKPLLLNSSAVLRPNTPAPTMTIWRCLSIFKCDTVSGCLDEVALVDTDSQECRQDKKQTAEGMNGTSRNLSRCRATTNEKQQMI